MDAFEYVVVLTSIILGLGIAQILTGVSDMISHWEKVKFSVPHCAYIVVVFLIHVQDWWHTYTYQETIKVWTLPTVISILLFPIVLFLQARMLFPTGFRQMETNLAFYFQDRWKWMYGFGLITVMISIWNNSIIAEIPVYEQYFQLVYLVLYLTFIVANVQKTIYHTIFTLAQLAVWVGYIIAHDQVL